MRYLICLWLCIVALQAPCQQQYSQFERDLTQLGTGTWYARVSTWGQAGQYAQCTYSSITFTLSEHTFSAFRCYPFTHDVDLMLPATGLWSHYRRDTTDYVVLSTSQSRRDTFAISIAFDDDDHHNGDPYFHSPFGDRIDVTHTGQRPPYIELATTYRAQKN